MRSLRIFSFLCVCLFSVKLSAHEGHHHGRANSVNQVMKAGDLQVSLDIVPRTRHDEMMKMMNVGDVSDRDSNYFVIVTVVNQKTGQVVKNAKVNLVVTDPRGRRTSKETHIMEGEGMYHYAAGFARAQGGKYRFKAEITMAGKSIAPEAEINLD